MFHSRKLYYTLFVVGALYVLLVQQFFQNEGKYILQSPTYNTESPYTFNIDFQELNIPINKEISLHGIWFKHEDPKGIILLFPDSDEDLRELKMDDSYYYSCGFDVLITAFRGTAKSEGKLKTESDLFSDAHHWYNFAKSQFPENKIVIVGQGFGSSIAAQLAANKQANALILETPHFASGEFNAKSRFWWLPYSYFTSFPLKTWEDVRKTQSEIILIQDKAKRGQESCLTKYLKPSDKEYWLGKYEDILWSSNPVNAQLFNEVLKPLLLHKTE